MKRFLAMILVVISIFTFLLPLTVMAEEASNTVRINCNAIGSDANKKQLRVYFQNVETGEVIDRKITTVGVNKFTDIPAGEYEFVKCTLYNNENIVYELAREVDTLVVYDDQPSAFSFKLAATATEAYEGAAADHKQQQKAAIIYAILSVVILILFSLWGILAFIGRRKNRTKWVARFVLHLLLSTAFLLLAIAITKANSDMAFVWLIGAGFPYGFAAGTLLFGGSSSGTVYVSTKTANSIFSIQMILITTFAIIVGVIALPFVFTRDIVKIVKNPDFY